MDNFTQPNLITNSKTLDLSKRIQDRLDWDKRVSLADIHITLNAGQVTVFGKVDSEWRLKAADDIITSTKGVTKVINQIEIPIAFERSDSDLKVLLERRMRTIATAEDELITVRVDHGTVKLEGTLNSLSKKASAVGFVWELSGVKDCENLLKIRSPLPQAPRSVRGPRMQDFRVDPFLRP